MVQLLAKAGSEGLVPWGDMLGELMYRAGMAQTWIAGSLVILVGGLIALRQLPRNTEQTRRTHDLSSIAAAPLVLAALLWPLLVFLVLEFLPMLIAVAIIAAIVRVAEAAVK